MPLVPSLPLRPTVFAGASSLAGSLHVGDNIMLATPDGSRALAADGISSIACTLAGTWSLPDTMAFEITSAFDAGEMPEALFRASGEDQATEGHQRVDVELLRMSQWPRMLAAAIESHGLHLLRESELERMMTASIRQDPNILAMTVAFDVGTFTPRAGLEHPVEDYCRMVVRDRHTGHLEFRDLLPPPRGSYDPLYREWPWFALPKARGRSLWSPAYIDESAGAVPLITFSAVIRQRGVFVGVATMDVELDPSSTVAVPSLIAHLDAQDAAEAQFAKSAPPRPKEGDPSAGTSSELSPLQATLALERLAEAPRRLAVSLADRLAPAAPVTPAAASALAAASPHTSQTAELFAGIHRVLDEEPCAHCVSVGFAADCWAGHPRYLVSAVRKQSGVETREQSPLVRESCK